MTLLRRFDREQKVVGGILVAIGVLVFASMGMSRDASGGALSFEPAPQGDSQASSGAASPEAQKSGNTPRTPPAPDKASTPRTQPAGQARALTRAPRPADPAGEAAPDTTAGPQQTTASPQENTASPPTKREPDKAAARDRPEAKPTASPELTSAQVRSLPAHATLESAVAALGQPLTTAELRGKYGAGPIQLLLGQQPAGSVCRYYGLAPGEPAPLVRLCFDAKGSLATREFVAPPPKA